MNTTKITEVTGRIIAIRRLTNSRNGNPRFTITAEFVALGTLTQAWNTAADHSSNYEVGNRGFSVGDVVTLTIGGRGTIVDMRAAR